MDLAKQKIWHKAYQKALETITSLRNHCDFTFQQDTNNADTVYILNAFEPTAKKDTPGVNIEREAVSATRKELKLDQFYYFNIEIDDVRAATRSEKKKRMATMPPNGIFEKIKGKVLNTRLGPS